MRYSLSRFLYLSFVISIVFGIFWMTMGQYPDFWVGLYNYTFGMIFGWQDAPHTNSKYRGEVVGAMIQGCLGTLIIFFLIYVHNKIWRATSLR